MQSKLAICTLLVGAAVQFGCTDGSGPDQDDGAQPTTTPGAPQAVGDAFTPEDARSSLTSLLSTAHPVSPVMQSRAEAGDSDVARLVVEDGVISFSEYEAAFLDRNRCLLDAGVEVPFQELTGAGEFDSALITRGTEAFERSGESIESCSRDYVAVHELWLEVIVHHKTAVINGSREWMRRCIDSSASVPVTQSDTAGSAQDETYWRCRTEMQREFGLYSVGFGVAE